MENRETKTLTTPAGKQLEIVTYLTARERNALRDTVMNKFKFNITGDGVKQTNAAEVKEVAADLLVAADDQMITITVTSYDNSQEKILDRILDADASEYDFILENCKKIKNGDFLMAK